jgi:hypothetical protein
VVGATGVVAVVLWPWLRQAGSVIPDASGGLGAVARLIVWILSWVAHALATAPTRLFDANIFHPIPRMLTASESLLSAVVVTGPVYGLTGNPLLAVNLAAIGTYVLALVLAYALMRALRLPIGAAVVASVAFALGPLEVPADVHVLQYPNWVLAAVLLACVRAEWRGRYGWVLPVVTFAVFSSYYMAAMTAALLTCEALLVWRTRGRTSSLRLAAASAPAFALLAVFSIPYMRGPAQSPPAGAFDLSAAVARVLWRMLLDPRSINPGLGAGTMLLAGVGLILPLARRCRPEVRWWRWFMLTVVGASLGAPYVVRIGSLNLPMPSVLLAATPLRSHLRWVLLAHVGLVGFVAESSGAMMRRLGESKARGLRGPLFVALLVLVWLPRGPHLLDQPFTTLPVGEAVPPVDRWLALHASGPLFEPPAPSVANWLPQADTMVHSIAHWLPLLNGHTGFPPWQYQAITPELNQLPDLAALQTVVDLTGLRWILVRGDRVPEWYRAAWETFANRGRGVERVPYGGPDLLLRVTLASRRDWAAALARGAPPAGQTALGTSLAPLDDAEVRGRVIARVAPRMVRGTTRSAARLTVANTGVQTWPALVAPRAPDAGVVRLVVRWRAEGGSPVSESLVPLPRDVAPGDTVRFRSELPVPARPGVYGVELAVTQRGGASMQRVEPAVARVVVE